MIADSKANKLYEDFIKAERELNSMMKTNISLSDLETVVHLQEQVQEKYYLFNDYVNKFM